jgi:RimJ/RimL family protein N-acetyltransferase
LVARETARGAVVGSTRYSTAAAPNRRVAIAHRCYSTRAPPTAINTECKLLLLTHAFETLGCIAVEFHTHWFNHASRAAIERLGAKQDGVLRSHQLMPDGSRRDTVVFSIIDGEWPAVKAHLRFLLVRPPD